MPDETYRLPPVRLSRKEAFSFALVRKLLAVFEGTPLDMEMRSVLAKIAESLEGEIRVEPEWLGEHVSVLPRTGYRWTPPSGRRPRAFWSAARPSGPITRPSRARCRLTSWAPCTCWPTSGFEILEVNAPKITRMSKAERVALKGAADEAGLGLTYSIGMTADMDLASENAATRKKGVSFLQDLSQAMKSMGGTIMAGINYNSWPRKLCPGEDEEVLTERAVQGVKEAIKSAEDCDVLFCVEVVNRFEHFMMNTAAEGIAFCERVGSPTATSPRHVPHEH